MPTAIFTHPACQKHNPGATHPESPARLNSVLASLRTEAFAALDWQDAPAASIDQLALAHPREHVEAVLERIPSEGQAYFDADTGVSPDSGEAALRASGAICAAIDTVAAKKADNAFCAVRPPGHHAEASRPMGFCLFNGVAVGAQYARRQYGMKRVAVVDFDVHHGNGTQSMFWDEADLFYASTHQFPYYPGTGNKNEHGESGNIFNAPMPAMSGRPTFETAYHDYILPALRTFEPELLLVSAGFDAHADDPLASLMLEDEDYSWLTNELLNVAADICDGRVVSVLEGGYDLKALGRSAANHVTALMDY